VRHNPRELNPKRNFVSSANQVSTDDSYPYFYHGEPYFSDYRGRWLNKQLAEMDQISVEDMMELQMDNQSLKAMEILPVFLKSMQSYNTESTLDEKQREILRKLEKWNYTFDAKQIEPVYFDLWYTQFYRQTWDEFYAMRDSIPVSWPQSWRTIDLAVNEPNHSYFDITETESKETAGDIVFLAFQKMTESAQKLNDNGIHNWGTKKRTNVSHLANIPAFSRTLTEASGHGDALNATSSTNGPSWRMIVELTDPVSAWVVYPGGQSGTPGDPFYDDMITDWVKGNYHKVRFVSSPEELNDHQTFTIRINHP
jgi:penicillin amidase